MCITMMLLVWIEAHPRLVADVCKAYAAASWSLSRARAWGSLWGAGANTSHILEEHTRMDMFYVMSKWFETFGEWLDLLGSSTSYLTRFTCVWTQSLMEGSVPKNVWSSCVISNYLTKSSQSKCLTNNCRHLPSLTDGDSPPVRWPNPWVIWPAWLPEVKLASLDVTSMTASARVTQCNSKRAVGLSSCLICVAYLQSLKSEWKWFPQNEFSK